MREWIQINLVNFEDYRKYVSVFDKSIRYVSSQALVDKA